jgi:transcriptional regulator with XRE-family HTH domain
MAYSTLNENLGKKIKRARLDARMGQQMLADLIGSSQNAISHYEQGKRSIPLELLSTIARELEKPLSYFLESEDNLIIVKGTKLHEIVNDIQSSRSLNSEINLLYAIWRFVQDRGTKLTS